MNMFEAASNYTFTENGALTYSTSQSKCLDLFAMGGALRNRTSLEIIELIDNAWYENPYMCLCVLFYLRDIREGQGERRTFQIAIRHIVDKYLTSQEEKEILIKACIEFGYWKDVFTIFTFDEYKGYVKETYNSHVSEDKYDLMEKYLPSISSKKNALAEKIGAYLGLSPKQYRKYLSKARSSINVVEKNLCAKDYSKIIYSEVPSKASLIYKDAFKRNDSVRYEEFLNQVKNKTSKINTGALFPYEIIRKYIKRNTSDDSLEVMWSNLKDYTNNENNIAVVDVSGSMTCPDYLPLSVAISLGIYFAERNKGIFHNKMITFSKKPSFISFEDEDNLFTRINKTAQANWGMNTDLQAVFDLILTACVREKVPQNEIARTIYIISDMELDVACRDNKKTNFEEIDRKFREAGYERPNLVFWNVNSVQNNLPVKKDENGTALVSGCSPSIFEMAMSNDMNPIKIMEDTVLKERYKKFADYLVR